MSFGLRLREVRLQAVVVGLAEGIELVIVAARAADRHAQERRAHDVGHLGEHFVVRTGHVLVAGVLAQRPQAIEAAGDEHGVGFFGSISSPASCSFTNSVVRLVVIEALRPRNRDSARRRAGACRTRSRRTRRSARHRASGGPTVRRSAAKRAGGPPPSPRPWASWSRTKASISSGVGGRPVRSKVTRRIRVARSAGGRGLQSGFLEAGENEGVDRRLHPRLVGGRGEGGRRGIFAGLEGPVAALCRGVDAERRDRHFRGRQDHAGT